MSIFQNILCRKSKTVICLYIHRWHIYHFTRMFIVYLGIFLGLHNLTSQLSDKFTRTLTRLSKLLVVKFLTVERAPVSKCQKERQKKSSNFKKFKSKMSFKLLWETSIFWHQTNTHSSSPQPLFWVTFVKKKSRTIKHLFTTSDCAVRVKNLP